MRALIQRTTAASVSVEGAVKGSIGPGLVILFGAGQGDTEADLDWLVRKTVNLRIFEDEAGKLNLSIKDIGGSILLVSQFTLYADCRRGNRPSFTQAAAPEVANALYEQFAQRLRQEGVAVETGVFQAYMQVELVNDGPVTIWLETPDKATN